MKKTMSMMLATLMLLVVMASSTQAQSGTLWKKFSKDWNQFSKEVQHVIVKFKLMDGSGNGNGDCPGFVDADSDGVCDNCGSGDCDGTGDGNGDGTGNGGGRHGLGDGTGDGGGQRGGGDCDGTGSGKP